MSFTCPPAKKQRQYQTSQFMTWGVIPTAAGYVPTSAGGKKDGGQVEQLAAMAMLTDKAQLKTNQLRGLIDKKAGNTTEHNLQQFVLLQSFLQMDLQNEADARERFLKKMTANRVAVSPADVPLGGYILDTIQITRPFAIKLWNTPRLDGCFLRLGIAKHIGAIRTVRNSILVTIPIQPMNSSIGRT
jgi:hypothetical protein